MAFSFDDYIYSKQYILIESKETKISKSLYDSNEPENIDDYLYSVVTSVTQKTVNGVKKHLIQYEDRQLGWVELKDSIQIFRFKPRNFLVIESNFQSNELNTKMGIEKDFISHFKGKLLTVKSQVIYNNERYYSVFLKNKFHGFHHEQHLDPLHEVNVELSRENLKDVDLSILSNLTKPVTEVPDFERAQLLSVFCSNNTVKIQLDKNVYWTSLSQLSNFEMPELSMEDVTTEQLHYDDLIHSAEETFEKSKNMLKTIISAKDYINDTNVSKYLKFASDNTNSRDDVKEIKEELNSFKSENLQLKRELRKEQNNHKLAIQRLDHQIDYNSRVETQRDKYKDRMQLVEQKLKSLNEKYQELKTKTVQKRRKFL